MSLRALPTGLVLCGLLLGACVSVAQDAATPVIYPPADETASLAQTASAQFAAGNVAGALATHAAMEFELTGAARSAQRDALWAALNALPPDADLGTVTSGFGRGWIELVQLARSGAPLVAFEEWRQRHPDHPGESQIAAGLAVPASPTTAVPVGGRIALLLPATGPLAQAAKAIQAGAEAAHSRAGPAALPVAVFDTSGSLDAALAAATVQGSAAFIGPLRKEDVAAMAERAFDRPVITLNYPDAGRFLPAGLTAFGLAPEDEARAAAVHASGSSLLRAAILAQDGDWGTRAAAAFRAEFEARGGVVLAESSFKAGTVDFTPLIKRALGIGAAEARAKKVETAGIKAESEPMPRGDLDVIFLAARSAQAKLIWPQMRYLRAGRIATYALAAAGDGGNQDLGRLRLCDAPWRIEQRGELAARRGELALVNPRTADAQRLFALGYDAYELARQTLSTPLVPGEEMPGLTGTLVLDSAGAVRRRLDCVTLNAPRLEAEPDGAAGETN